MGVIPVLALSIVLLLVAIATSLRLVRSTGQRLPWLLLSAALVLMTFRLAVALAGVFSGPPRALDVSQELLALAIAALILLAVRTLGTHVQDVSRMRDERAATDATYRALLSNLPMAASVVEQDGTFRFLNPAQLASLTGYDAVPERGREFWLSLVHPDDRPEVEGAIARAFGGATVRLLARFCHSDGSWRWAGTLFFPRREADRITGVNGLTSDVTERQVLEQRMRHFQKMEALGAMGSGIAHDFNNILGGILGNIELALRRLEPDHPARGRLDDAARAALRASEHTRQLLAFTRREVLHPRPVNLNEVCREAVALVRPAVDPRIEFDVRRETGLWETMGDPGELVQVLVNLFLNARDAMPQGGRVILETANLVLDETYARVHPEGRTGQFVRLMVGDTGTGMPPEVRARIFEPFFTTKPEGQGTGLGLAMVYGTIRRHGGWIQCYSEVGRGTRFSIYLPRGGAVAAEAPQPGAAEEQVPGGTETVLLVDDDEDLRAVGVESLRELGYSVLTARDGVEALEVFTVHKDRIRLVILDLSMPRMSGRDALARLRELDPGIRVLVTSGHSLDNAAQELLDQGAAGFVGKPYRLAEMGWAVRAALDG